jgi:hypothetical protein
MSTRQRLYVLRATSSDGLSILVGPLDAGEGVLVVDEHLAPHGWTPKFLPLTPIDLAIGHFTAAQRREAVEGADLFVALRRAIYGDPDNDGIECNRAAALITHLEAHRPLRMWSGDEECLLGECGHDTVDGRCAGLQPAGVICVCCSAIYDSGTEFGPEWLAACRVEWPCQPISAAADHYGLPQDL